MKTNRISSVGIVLLLVLTMRSLHAQDRPDSVRQRLRCRLAAQIITTGHPAPHDVWALRTIRTCGLAGGVAIASGLRALRSEDYGPHLDALAGLTLWLRDGQVFEVAMSIAKDPTASVAARLLMMRTLVWQIESVPLGGADYPTIATGEAYDGRFHCPGDAMVDFVRTDGSPLPPTYLTDALTLGDSMMHDAALAPDLRRMGACLRATARFEQGSGHGT